MPVEKRVFSAGMDLDSDDRLIGQGFYREAENIRVGSSEGMDVGAVENLRGNSFKGGHYWETGTTIGSHRSEERNSIIYFVYDSEGNHGIYERTKDEFRIILINSILNFNPDCLITGINDIDGLLYWTDDYNPPRKLNIEKAIIHMQSQGVNSDGYSSLLSDGSFLDRQKFISAIKAQPVQRPTWTFVTDTTKDYNRVRRGKFFKFKYRYIYDDNEKSAWSSVSDLAYTDYDVIESTDVAFNEFSYENINLYNCIVVSFLNGHETVERIEVAASESDSDFFLIADVKRDSNVSTQAINFYNDSTYTILEVNESIKPYDDVPRLAKAQELIDGNKIAYGNYLSGYNHHQVRYNLAPQYFSPVFSTISDPSDFGPTIYLDEDVAFGQEFVEVEGPGNEDYFIFKRNASGVASNAATFEAHLIGLGYQISPGDIIEIEYSLGATEEPNSLSPSSPGEEGPNTNVYPLVPDSIIISIPQSADNAYEYLYEQLAEYDMAGSSGSISLMSRGGIFRRYNDSEYAPVLTLDDACEFIDEEYGGCKFFQRIGYTLTYNTGVNVSTEFTDDFWYQQPNQSMSSFDFNPFTPTGVVSELISNEDNGKVAGKVGIYSFRMRLSSSSPENLTQNFGFPSSNSFSTFKSGAYHSFGIVYHDDYGRFSLINSPKSVYVPHLNNRGVSSGDDFFGAKIKWTIKDYAPPWAKYYSWFYAGNSRTYDFLQFKIVDISPENSNIPSVENEIVRVSLRLLSEFQSQNDKTVVSYDFTEGDRIRFLKKPDGSYFPQDIDLEIISAQDAEDGDYIISIPRMSVLDSTSEYNECFVEIYTPQDEKTPEKQIFKEISDKYPIEQVSLVNGQQVGIHSVESGMFSRGDVYLTRRSVYGGQFPNTFVCETPNLSDYKPSKIRDGGKANAYDREQGEQRYIANVTYSEPYISGTSINGLSSFNPVIQPYKEYDRAYGSIQKLYSQDNSLTIFQEDKVNRSVVSRNVLYDNQGSATLVGTIANVLSDAISYQGEYGISNHPESFAEYGGRIYFVDAKRGAVLRLSRDGITPISQYKMSDYFMDVLTDNVSKKIYGGYDPRFGEYIVSIKGVKTVAFSEAMNLWTSFYWYSPETMQYLYKDLYSFKNGRIYVHGNDSPYNTFYNVFVPSTIKFVFNALPSDKKVFQAISMEGNSLWNMTEATTPSGQVTYLNADDFDELEGFYYSDLLFDALTPNVQNGLIEGDRMRDYSITVSLYNAQDSHAELFASNMVFSKSFRHNG